MTQVAESSGINDQAASPEAPPPRHRATGEVQLPSGGMSGSSTGLGVLALLWGVVLVAVGGLLIRDAVVVTSRAEGRPWTQSTFEAVPGMRPDVALLVAATAVGVVGVVLLVRAMRRRRNAGVPVKAQVGTSIRHRHLSRLMAGQLQSLEGVLTAHVRVQGETIRAHVRAAGDVDHADLQARAQELIARECAAITTPLHVFVRTREKDVD